MESTPCFWDCERISIYIPLVRVFWIIRRLSDAFSIRKEVYQFD